MPLSIFCPDVRITRSPFHGRRKMYFMSLLGEQTIRQHDANSLTEMLYRSGQCYFGWFIRSSRRWLDTQIAESALTCRDSETPGWTITRSTPQETQRKGRADGSSFNVRVFSSFWDHSRCCNVCWRSWLTFAYFLCRKGWGECGTLVIAYWMLVDCLSEGFSWTNSRFMW